MSKRRGELRLLVLPGAGRATRQLWMTRRKVWTALLLGLCISASCAWAGYRIADGLLGEHAAWTPP